MAWRWLNVRQLTNLEVAALRGKLLKEQGGRCLLCGTAITGRLRGGAVLDHDHASGVVRSVLCRVCNSGEGKVKSCATRYGGGADKALGWLKRLVAYLELHQEPQTQYLYPKKAPARRKRAAKIT